MSAARPILVVDDDDDIRDVVAMAIESLGYTVASAADGVEALEVLSKGLEPSMILLDMMMPRMDGEGFLAAMRNDPALVKTPIVLLSGHAEARQKAVSLGAHGCLIKPIELDELVATVERFAGKA